MGEQSTSSPSAGVDFTPIFVSKLKKNETSPSQESVRTVSSKNVSFAQYNPEYIPVPYSAPQDSDSDEIRKGDSKELVEFQRNANKEKCRNDGLSVDNTGNKENDKFWEFCYKEMTRADGEGNFPKVDKLNDLLIKIDSDDQVQKNVFQTSSEEKLFGTNEEEPKNTSKDKNRKSSRTNTKRSNKEGTSNNEMVKISNKEIAKTINKGSPKTSNKGSARTSNKGSPKTSNKGSPKTSNKGSPKTKEVRTDELLKNPSLNKMSRELSKVGDTISIIFNLCRGESYRTNSDADLPCCYRESSGELKVSKSGTKEDNLKKRDSSGGDVVIVCSTASSEKTSQVNLKRKNSGGKDVRASGSKSKQKKSRSSKNSLKSAENDSSGEDVGKVSKKAKKEKTSKEKLKRIDPTGEDARKVSKRAKKEKTSKDNLTIIDSSGEDVRATGGKSKRKKPQATKNSVIIIEDDPNGENMRPSASKKKRKKSHSSEDLLKAPESDSSGEDARPSASKKKRKKAHSSEDLLKTPESDSSGEDVKPSASKKKRKKSHSSEDLLKTPESDSSGEDVRPSESKKKRKKSNSSKSSSKTPESDSSGEDVRTKEYKKKPKKSRSSKSSLKTPDSDSSEEDERPSKSKKKLRKSRSASLVSFEDDSRDTAIGDSRNGINVLFPKQESKEVVALDSSDQAVQGTIVYDRGVQGTPRSGRRYSRTRIHRETGPNAPICQTSSSSNTSPGRRRILPLRVRSNQKVSGDDQLCQDGYQKEGNTEKIKCVGVFRSFILRKKCNDECPGKPEKSQGGKRGGKSKNKSTQEKMQTDKNTDTGSFRSEDRKKGIIQRLKGMVLTDLMQNGELCKPKKKGDDVEGCPQVKKKSH